MVKHYNNYDISSNFNSTDGLPRLPPGASIWKRLRRALHKSTLASRHTPDSRFYLRSWASFFAERRRQYKSHWYTVHPLSVFRMYWRILMFVVWMILLPCDIFLPAFAVRLYEEDDVYLNYVFILMYVMNCICNVDVLLNFFTGYLDGEHRIVLKLRSIAWRYVTGYWLVDMLSFTHMIHYLIIGEGGTDTTVFRIAYCLQFLRLVRLKAALENMKIITDKCGIGDTVYFVLYSTILGLYLIHFNACMICLVLDAVQSFHEEERMSFITQLYTIYETNYRLLYASELYAHCIFEVLNKYSLNYVTSELQPREMEDKIMVIFTVACALTFNIYLFMKVLYRMHLAYSSSIDYAVAREELQHFMSMQGFPADLQDEFLDGHELFYKKQHYDESSLMNSLSAAQKIDIFIHFYRSFLQKSRLFENLPTWQIAVLVKNMKWYFLRAGNEIEVNWRTNVTYFVVSGTLASYLEDGVEICHYNQGDSFGFNSARWRRAQSFTVIAIETCELCQVSQLDLHRVRSSVAKRPTIFYNL